ncbi:unnamed protein product [Zymoseptoria tritici ST99CH_3D1]|nr:unnamed protein product [Zymoseptoria tritici ST99CH_3D1]
MSTSMTPNAASTNIIINPGFENGSFTGSYIQADNWDRPNGGFPQVRNNIESAQYAHSGTAYESLTSYNSDDHYIITAISQMTSHGSPEVATLSYWFAVTAVETATCTFTVQFGGVSVYTQTITSTDSPADGQASDYKQVVVPGLILGDSKVLEFDFSCISTTTSEYEGKGVVSLDDVFLGF